MLSELFGRKSSQGGSSIDWNELNDIAQIDHIKEESKKYPVLIFKHSYRCGTSAMTLDRLRRKWNQDELGRLKSYFLDLISFREVSSQIADTFGVWHESPQILLIHLGKCVYHTSHMGISYDEMQEKVERLDSAG